MVPSAVRQTTAEIYSLTAHVEASHPINLVEKVTGYYDHVIVPIMDASGGCCRQDCVVMGGEYLGTEWVTST